MVLMVSLVPRPEEEEEKGPGFSHLRMQLIISDITSGRVPMMPLKSHGGLYDVSIQGRYPPLQTSLAR